MVIGDDHRKVQLVLDSKPNDSYWSYWIYIMKF